MGIFFLMVGYLSSVGSDKWETRYHSCISGGGVLGASYVDAALLALAYLCSTFSLLRTNDPSPNDNVDSLNLALSLDSLRWGIC